jgi:hypothetical protein
VAAYLIYLTRKKLENIIMDTIVKHKAICGDCDSKAAAIWLEPYGDSFLAVISCPSCGTSFDTNLDAADIEALR